MKVLRAVYTLTDVSVVTHMPFDLNPTRHKRVLATAFEKAKQEMIEQIRAERGPREGRIELVIEEVEVDDGWALWPEETTND